MNRIGKAVSYRRMRMLAVLIVLVTVEAGFYWSTALRGMSMTAMWWMVDFLVLFCIYGMRRLSRLDRKSTRLVTLYFLWMIICSVRGAFVAENYWEYKQLVTGFLTLSIPAFAVVFSNGQVLRTCLNYWMRFALPLLLVFFLFGFQGQALHFYVGPVLTLSCFLPIIPRGWRCLFVAILLAMIFADMGARSQIIKAVMAFLLSFALVIAKHITDNILKIAHWACYILAIVLLVLGISGEYNIFEDLSSHEGQYTQKVVRDGEVVEEDAAADTRTFIYVEVISSAIEHNYVLFGRTPARGNDSASFGAYAAEDLGTGKYERHSNEVCHPNVFTWLGLVGMIMYSLLYMRSSWLAVYRSKNIYVKLVGVYIAFRWLYGWIEDWNSFDIANLSLWMLMAIGFSTEFRSMSNAEFRRWVRSIFVKRTITQRNIVATNN